MSVRGHNIRVGKVEIYAEEHLAALIDCGSRNRKVNLGELTLLSAVRGSCNLQN